MILPVSSSSTPEHPLHVLVGRLRPNQVTRLREGSRLGSRAGALPPHHHVEATQTEGAKADVSIPVARMSSQRRSDFKLELDPHGIVVRIPHLLAHLGSGDVLSLHAGLGVVRQGRVQVEAGRLQALLLVAALALGGVVEDEVDVVNGVATARVGGGPACRGCPGADGRGGEVPGCPEAGPEADAGMFRDEHVDEI
jgi:hypothetical protein